METPTAETAGPALYVNVQNVCRNLQSSPSSPSANTSKDDGKRGKTTAHSSGATFSLTHLRCFPKAGRLLKGELMSVVIYSVAEP